jgi:hypothetical protein
VRTTLRSMFDPRTQVKLSLVKNDERRTRLARQGLESVGRFAPDEILNRWEALFRSLTDQRIALQDVHPPTPATGRS